MKTATALVLLFSSLTATAFAQCEAPVPCQDAEMNALNTTDCQTYHAFIARGSDSGYPGHLGPLIKLVCNSLNSEDNTTCGYENVVYPANSSYAGKEMWCKSAAIGAEAGQSQMSEYAERCPDAKLILLGYSQGGSVGLDILGGGGGPVFECEQADNPTMDRNTVPGANIVAAAIFGAARRNAHQNYTVKGGKDYNGKATRTTEQLAGLNQYSSILREYCNIGDPMCAPDSKPQDVQQHLNYFKTYNDEAAKWVIGTAKGKKVKIDDSSASSSGTKSASHSATKTTGAKQATATHSDSGSIQGNAEAATQGTQGSAVASVGGGLMAALSMAVGALLLLV